MEKWGRERGIFPISSLEVCLLPSPLPPTNIHMTQQNKSFSDFHCHRWMARHWKTLLDKLGRREMGRIGERMQSNAILRTHYKDMRDDGKTQRKRTGKTHAIKTVAWSQNDPFFQHFKGFCFEIWDRYLRRHNDFVDSARICLRKQWVEFQRISFHPPDCFSP